MLKNMFDGLFLLHVGYNLAVFCVGKALREWFKWVVIVFSKPFSF